MEHAKNFSHSQGRDFVGPRRPLSWPRTCLLAAAVFILYVLFGHCRVKCLQNYSSSTLGRRFRFLKLLLLLCGLCYPGGGENLLLPYIGGARRYAWNDMQVDMQAFADWTCMCTQDGVLLRRLNRRKGTY